MRPTILLCFAFLLSKCVFVAHGDKCTRNHEIVPLEGDRFGCERRDGIPRAVLRLGDVRTYANMHIHIRCNARDLQWTGYKAGGDWGLGASDESRDYATCVKYCDVSGEGLEIIAPIGDHFDLATSCKDPTMDLFFNDARVDGNRAECRFLTGWGHLRYLDNAVAPLSFECRKAPTPCSYLPAEGIHFDDATKTLACPLTGNLLKGIDHNGNLYPSVKCGRMDRSSVWKANTGEDFENSGSKIAEASPTLNVTCVEYARITLDCTSIGDGIEVRRNGDLVEVTCADSALGLIQGDSKMENGLANCSLNDGWKTGAKLITKDIEKTLQFKCAKPCVLQSPNGIHSDNATNTFSCIAGDASITSLLSIVVGSTPYNEIQCEIDGGWRGKEDNGQYTSIAHAFVEQESTCVNYCASTGNDTVVNRTPNDLEVSCADSGLGLSMKFGPTRYKSLKCNINDGWRATGWKGDQEIGKSIDRMDFTCEKYDYKCDMPSVEGFHYDPNTKTLSCNKGDGIFVIEYSSKQYDHFRCDEANGWAGKRKGTQGQIDYFKLPDSPLAGKCVEYCAVNGTGLKVEKVVQYGAEHIQVSCPDSDRGRLFATVEHRDSRNGRLRVSFDVASCWPNKGWSQRESRQFMMTEDARTPMHFECRDREQLSHSIATPATERPTVRMSYTEDPLMTAGEKKADPIPTGNFGVIAIGAIIVAVVAAIVAIVAIVKLMKRTGVLRRE